MADPLIDQLDALRALHETGTTAKAAARLRLTQSTISKRIAALEARLGWAPTERVGRGLRLREPAVHLLAELAPLLVAVEERLAAAAAPDVATVRIGAAESMLASWLAPVLRLAEVESGVRLQLHAHRGVAVLARLRSGDFDLAVSADADGDAGLVVEPLGREAMVLVGEADDGAGPLGVCSIEPASLTGAWLHAQLARRSDLRVVRPMESFAAALGLARAGFEPALVPAGLAIGLTFRAVRGLARPIALSSRPLARQRAAVALVARALLQHAPRALAALSTAGG
jgi:DNA-binding transcriptional LysR family regulator